MQEQVKSLQDIVRLIPVKKKTGYQAKGGYDGKATPIKWARILAFIEGWQRAHNGQTPSYQAMANELGWADSAVKYHIRRMEDRGLLMIMATMPLRIILKSPVGITLEGARRLDENIKPTRLPAEWEAMSTKDRFLAADAKRQIVAHKCGTVWRDSGRRPSIRELLDATGMQSASHIHAMLDTLVKRGMVNNPDERQLTEAGRIAYGFTKSAPRPPQKEEIMSKPVIIIPTKTPKMAVLKQIARFIEDHWTTYGCAPEFRDIAKSLGYKALSVISRGVAFMVEQGWATHQKGHQRDTQLTDKGRELLLDRPTAAPAPVEAPIRREARIVVGSDRCMDQEAEPQAFGTRGSVGTAFGTIGSVVALESTSAVARGKFYRGGEMADEALDLGSVATPALVMELIERGYTVTKR